MILLPPANVSAPRDRRVGDRRAADRRKATVEEAGAGPEPVAPTRQMRPRNGGRRKTDGDPAPVVAAPVVSSASKPHAPLIAQMIASVLGFEQTRLRRRGSIEDAAKLYGRKPDRPRPSRGEA